MLGKVWDKLRGFKQGLTRGSSDPQSSQILQEKYLSFKKLLESNSELLNIITDIDEKLQGHALFGMSYVRSQSTRAAFHAQRMVASLSQLNRSDNRELVAALERIKSRIKELVEHKHDVAPERYVIPYSQIGKEMVDWVGGKNANLGELCSRLHLPVPHGFAITTRAQEEIYRANELHDEISKIKMEVALDDLETLTEASSAIRELIMEARVPADVQAAIHEGFDAVTATLKRADPDASPAVALRSSAIGEDSEQSFAGQYLTFLNVTRDNLLECYKRILASLYSPQAMIYRLTKGLMDDACSMSVACLEMVRSLASGVMYTRHPFNIIEDRVIINAVWGLGPYAVDGTVTPDAYVLDKKPEVRLREQVVARQEVQLVPAPEGSGVIQAEVPRELRDSPCLGREHLLALGQYALRLEEHYQSPQDVEWALDGRNRLSILQTRPLNLQARTPGEPKTGIPRVEGYPVLLEAGSVACPGIGHGPAFHASADDDLNSFPAGAVLIAKRSNPRFVMVMPKAQAIITDAGSVSGHMAALAREYDVPAILGARTATAEIPAGTMITVDAYSGRVYQGRVEELLSFEKPKHAHMTDTPVHRVLKQIADLILPLNLTDPKAETFAPQHCRTIHDITRYVHEFSYKAMFRISDHVHPGDSHAVQLKARLPLDLYVVDLGGGLAEPPPGEKKIGPEQVVSTPLNALLRGMLRDDLRWDQPRPVEIEGLLSVISGQMLSPAHSGLGERSYAIVSDHYLNFSSRVGYHYGVLDTFCGPTINKNFITFAFKGGAADDVRRNRRAAAIARILEGLEFTVKIQGDRVDARFQKDTQEVMEERLDWLGRLLIFTRQTDMLMHNDQCVEIFAESFLKEEFDLELLMRPRQ
ncbi:MAG: PEP-utilizing enzyme [Desulfobacterales bacterium]|jgi:pyruvate,water dikinase|nr:PEP-utilizing enzyme [Desulfobacterales bacterium]